MRIRCVGGLHDGEWHDIDPRKNDVVLHKPTPIDIHQAVITRMSAAPFFEQTRYTVRRICASDHDERYDVVTFLAPENWSDPEAIRHQFAK
jgi:hypothetical protein